MAKEVELERLIHQEVEKMWQKRLNQWKLEREARKKLLADVLEGRARQLQERCKFIYQYQYIKIGGGLLDVDLAHEYLLYIHMQDHCMRPSFAEKCISSTVINFTNFVLTYMQIHDSMYTSIWL